MPLWSHLCLPWASLRTSGAPWASGAPLAFCSLPGASLEPPGPSLGFSEEFWGSLVPNPKLCASWSLSGASLEHPWSLPGVALASLEPPRASFRTPELRGPFGPFLEPLWNLSGDSREQILDRQNEPLQSAGAPGPHPSLHPKPTGAPSDKVNAIASA